MLLSVKLLISRRRPQQVSASERSDEAAKNRRLPAQDLGP